MAFASGSLFDSKGRSKVPTGKLKTLPDVQKALARNESYHPQLGRADGLRIRLSRIKGLTRGKAAELLREPYLFQCPPMDEFGYTTGFNHTKSPNYRGDEYAQRGGTVLKTMTFKTLIVEWGRFVTEPRFAVAAMKDDLEKIAEAGYPVQLLATHQYGTSPEFNRPVIIESVAVTEQSGEEDARYLDITISEYNLSEVERDAIKKGASKYPVTVVLHKNGSAGIKDGSKTKKIKGLRDDKSVTLTELAKAIYGKPSLASHIAKTQKPPIKNFGNNTPLIKHTRFKNKGGKIVVHSPPSSKKKK